MLQKILYTLNRKYSKKFDDIKLHRDMIGYVCIVSAGEERYVLKLFRSNYTNQALQSIAIMTYLYEAGYPTAYIIPTVSGKQYFNFDIQDETRIGVLYEYIIGVEPDKCKDIETIGRQTGLLHHLMGQYGSSLISHTKPFFIDRYTNILSEMKYERTDKFIELGNILWNRVEELPKGFCHGDYHTGNMLMNTSGQYVVFDFDAAAIGFPVYDIAVMCDRTDYFSLEEQMFDETSHMLERFLKGYTDYTTLSSAEIHSIYDFIAIRHFEAQATIIESLGYSCVDLKFIEDQFIWLKQWEILCRTKL